MGCYGNGCWQEILGTDSTTGFTWPPKVSGSTSGSFQLLVNPPATGPFPTPVTVNNYMTNKIQYVTGHTGAPTRALFSEITQSGCCGVLSMDTNPAANGSTQNPYIISPANDTPDLYISYWVKFQPDLLQKLNNTWRALFETKTTDTDYRFSVGIASYGGAPYWRVITDGWTPQYKENWKKENSGVPVPVGEWFKLEVFWHRSTGSDGRAWAAVNGQVIGDFSGPTIGPNRSRIDRIMVSQLYSGSAYPISQWVDDLQIWSTFPTAVPGSAWYDPPYASH
jgi:hypothetical protein